MSQTLCFGYFCSSSAEPSATQCDMVLLTLDIGYNGVFSIDVCD